MHDDTPIREKPRRLPDPVTEEIEAQCEELRKIGVIEFSKSSWAAPVVPIRKKDGSLRLCVDYRKLNKVTKSDRFPMPNMNDLVFSLKGVKYFTALDLVRGYYQVPLDPETAECTAFSTPRNHYQFRRLCFGLKNAPAAFQREMQEVLRDFDSKQVIVYIDDILILGRSFEEHLQLVERVLSTLRQYGMKVKLAKCEWFKPEVAFLGHVVGRDGVRKCSEYVESVVTFPRPETVKKLRSFLGLVNFQRKFIENCSVISRPLNAWMGKPDKTKILWSEDLVESFEKLKQAMARDVQLTYPDYSDDAEPLVLSSDASSFGAGACLTQNQSGDVRVIAYASTTFNSAQLNYSTIEQELAAIRWSVHAFRGFIMGVKFILYTDHRPLIFMSNMSKQNTRIIRTMNELAEYDFDVRFRPGRDNFVADTMSRLYTPPEIEDHEELGPQLPEGIYVSKPAVGGGNSLVDSLWSVLTTFKLHERPELKTPSNSGDLRRALHGELCKDPTKYRISKDRYEKCKLKLSKFDGQVPPIEFVLAFSSMFNLDVWVHHGMGKPVRYSCMEYSDSKVVDRVHLQCLGGIHYNPAVEAKHYKSDLPLGEDFSLAESGIQETEEFQELDEIGVSEVGICQYVSTPCACLFATRARISIQIRSRTCCAVLDTGAMISLVSDAVWWDLTPAERTSMNFSSDTVNLRSVAGALVRTVGQVEAQWSLSGQDYQHSTPCGLVGARDLPVCVILGANAIKQLGIVVDYSQGRMSYGFGSARISAPFLNASDPDYSVGVCLLQEYLFDPSAGISAETARKLQQSVGLTKRLCNLVERNLESTKWVGSTKKLRRYSAKLQIKNGLLVFQDGEHDKYVIPHSHMVTIAYDTHHKFSHPGRNKLLMLLQKSMWYPSMSKIVEDVCLSCQRCQQFKTRSQPITAPIIKIATERPFQLLAADCLSLPETPSGNVGCFVLVDHYTKWAHVVPIRDKRGDTIAKIFESRVLPSLPRKPERILSDNGPEFANHLFSSVLRKYNIAETKSTPNHPQSNGAVERLNRTLVEMLRCSGEENEEWDLLLTKVVLDYNHLPHSATGLSPSDFMLRILHTFDRAGDTAENEEAFWKLGNKNFTSFEVGDLVLKKKNLKGNLSSNKFKPRFDGPFRIKHVHTNGVTYILDAQTGRKELRAHHSQLRRYVQAPDYLKRLHSEESGEACRDESLVICHDNQYLTDDESDCELDSSNADGIHVADCKRQIVPDEVPPVKEHYCNRSSVVVPEVISSNSKSNKSESPAATEISGRDSSVIQHVCPDSHSCVSGSIAGVQLNPGVTNLSAGSNHVINEHEGFADFLEQQSVLISSIDSILTQQSAILMEMTVENDYIGSVSDNDRDTIANDGNLESSSDSPSDTLCTLAPLFDTVSAEASNIFGHDQRSASYNYEEVSVESVTPPDLPLLITKPQSFCVKQRQRHRLTAINRCIREMRTSMHDSYERLQTRFSNVESAAALRRSQFEARVVSPVVQGYRTRSRGPVGDLPNVQTHILEYTKGRYPRN